MTILSVAAVKGGVGKTTLALNIAIALALRGRSVWLIDADLQASTSQALANRAAAEIEPSIATAHYTDKDQLKAQLRLMSPKFDYVVIDCGGRDGQTLRMSLSQSDIVLIPFQPRSIDVWALQGIAQNIAEIQDAGKVLQAFAVLNMADSQGSDNQDAAAAVADFPNLTLLDTPIRRRKAFANAAGEGFSVLEHEPADPKARAELSALVDAIYPPKN